MSESNEFTSRSPLPVDSEEEVRDLLQAAGGRKPVPAEDLISMRAVARAEWQTMVRAERRAVKTRDLRVVALAASLLIAVSVGWFWSAAGPESAATVEFVLGQVRVDGTAGSLEVGEGLHSGAQIETLATSSGTQARLNVRMASGELRLDSGTRLSLDSADRVTLQEGAVYFESTAGGAAGDGAIQVVTPFGTVRDIGTQFDVRLADSGAALTVRVREGAISLDSGAASRSANRGEALEVAADGEVTLMQVAVDDQSWGWTRVGSAAFEIDGARLAEFLQWVSRETGWEVHYQDADLALAAESIELSNSIESLTAEEAIALVLPASDLAYEVSQGALRVRRRDGQ